MLLCLQRYDYILCYCPGKEMTLPDTLSHLKPKPGPEIALDIAIHHACLSPVQKETLQLAFEMDVEMCALADVIISGWPDDIKEVPCPLHPYWQHCEYHAHYVPTGNTMSHSLFKMDFCSGEKSSSSLHQKGRRTLVHYTNHIKASPKHSSSSVVVSSGLASKKPLRKLFGSVKQA